jgi:hypothetical protein
MKSLWMQVALLLSLVMPLYGQQGPPGAPPGRPEDRHVFERVERLKKVRMIEMLELSEDQSARFVPRLNDHESHRKELFKARNEALDRVDRLLRNRADAGELEKEFATIADLNTQMADEGNKFFGGLKDLLTETQRAKLLLFERQFDRELREAFREVQRRHQPPSE